MHKSVSPASEGKGGIGSIIPTVWRHRALVAELAKREFSARYQGSVGGFLWSFVQPIFLLSVYTFAFGVVLQARWGAEGGTLEYALMLFAGLIVFNAFSECMNRAPLLVVSNPNYVKKIVFPLEVLAVVLVVSAIANAVIGVFVWAIAHFILFGWPPASILLFPLVLLAYLPVLLAISWFLSGASVLVRDLVQFAAMISHALLFLTPIFYSVETAPASLRPFLIANPLSFIVIQFRAVLYEGRWPDLMGLSVYFLIATLVAMLALALFQRLRSTFADVL